MDERDLIRESQAGDLRAFERLVLEKRNQVFRIARQVLGDDEEAKDVAQLVFIRLWETIGRFHEGGSFNAWLHRITVNLALDFLRKRRSRERPGMLEADGMDWVATAAGAPGESLEPGEIQNIFRLLSRRLTPRQRAVFVLREIEELSTEEVSEVLGMRVSTVRNHVHAARKILQDGLKRLFPEYAKKRSGE